MIIFDGADVPQRFTSHSYIWTVFFFSYKIMFNQNTKFYFVHSFHKSKNAVAYTSAIPKEMV